MDKQNNRAFTLLEMVLVIVLLGALTAFSVPDMRGTFRRVQLKRVAGDAAALMRYAQSRAILKKCRVIFDFDEGNQAYQIRGELSGGQSYIANQWGRLFKVPTGVICDLSGNSLMFYPDGKIDPGRMVCCQDEQCRTVSTQEQRGRVLTMEGRIQ